VSLLDLSQVGGDVRILDRRQGQAGRAQDVLGLEVPQRPRLQRLDQRGNGLRRREQEQVAFQDQAMSRSCPAIGF
jgi:hypothetical protein